MTISIYKKIIERNHCPSNRDLDGRIKEIRKEFIGDYEFKNVPSKGEIVYIEESGKKFVISEVIHILSGEEYVILEVYDYREENICSKGSDSWCERIPLVVDI